MQLNLITDTNESCSLSATSIIAQTTNEGNSPTYEWWIDDIKIDHDKKELDISELKSATNIRCRVTSDKSCNSNNWVEKEMVIASNDFTILASKNEGEWQPLENSIVCLGDELNFQVLPELQQPLFWLDAMDVNGDRTKPNEGVTIPVWQNKSNSGYVMPYQYITNLRPTYSETGMNGEPAIMFGTNDSDGLPLFNTNNDNVLDGDWSMVITGKYYVTSRGDWNAFLGNESGNTGFAFYINRSGNGGRTRTKINGIKEQGRVYESGSTFVTVINKEAGTIRVFINGRLEDELEANSSTISNARAFYLGQSDGGNSSGSWYHKGPISEVLFYDTMLSDKQRNYIEGYLMHKWHLAQDIPLDHVYKENSPLDINLKTPNGETLNFDRNTKVQVISFTDTSNFGDYVFNRSSCSDFNRIYSINGVNQLGEDLIKYSVDNKKFKTGSSVFIPDEATLELATNYFIEGNYQWETPFGDLLPLNTNPKLIVVKPNNHLDVWKLHLKQDTGSCIQNDQIYDFTITVDNSLSALNESKQEVNVYPNPTSNIVNIKIPNLGLTSVKGMVCNTMQQLIFEGNFNVYSNTIKIPLNNLPSGIYLINLGLENPVNIKVIKR